MSLSTNSSFSSRFEAHPEHHERLLPRVGAVVEEGADHGAHRRAGGVRQVVVDHQRLRRLARSTASASGSQQTRRAASCCTPGRTMHNWPSGASGCCLPWLGSCWVCAGFIGGAHLAHGQVHEHAHEHDAEAVGPDAPREPAHQDAELASDVHNMTVARRPLSRAWCVAEFLILKACMQGGQSQGACGGDPRECDTLSCACHSAYAVRSLIHLPESKNPKPWSAHGLRVSWGKLPGVDRPPAFRYDW